MLFAIIMIFLAVDGLLIATFLSTTAAAKFYPSQAAENLCNSLKDVGLMKGNCTRNLPREPTTANTTTAPDTTTPALWPTTNPPEQDQTGALSVMLGTTLIGSAIIVLAIAAMIIQHCRVKASQGRGTRERDLGI